MIKISERLQQVANFVTEGSRVADIGSDHAMLPIYLVQNGKCPSAIAGELNAGPYEAARKGIAMAGLAKAIEARRGDGFAVMKAGEADTVTICGMGGSLMSDILEQGRLVGKLDGVTELVLQPNVGESLVRGWLLQHNWYLRNETIIEEDRKIYEILHAVHDTDAAAKNESLYDGSFLGIDKEPVWLRTMLIEMGPHLLRQPSAVLAKKWTQELAKLDRIYKQMSQSELPEAEQKKMQFLNGMKAIEEVLACLPTDIQSFK